MTSAPGGALRAIGKYEILEKIAEGGMGTVYKGRHAATGEVVAIKVVPPHMTGNPIMLKRFEQEFKAARELDHPNIVRAIEFGHDGTNYYMVMEFVDGPSLGQRIEREGALPETEARQIMVQIAQALHQAHRQGMIHRDVKPDNILLTQTGQAKLADLGLVKEIETDLNLTRTGRGLGTPHFMAPEQFRNAKNADERCDIYSLAATLYMAVTGELPFRACGPLEAWMKKTNNELPPPRTLLPALSERLDWAIRRAMAAEPSERPATCREFVEDLTGRSIRRTVLADGSGTQELWYLRYQDEAGALHTIRRSVAEIRRALKDKTLGNVEYVRASREKGSEFGPLREFPEFRDLVLQPGLPALKAAAADKPKQPALVPAGPVVARKVRTTVTPPKPPQINLATHQTRGLEWWHWLLLAAVGLATALVAFFMIGQR
jgi:eukaryotic-like serine/threonine-protein kinase